MKQNPILERYLLGRKGPGMCSLLKIPIMALAGVLWPSASKAQSPEHMALASCMSTGRNALECCVELTCDVMARSCLSHWDETAKMQCLASNCPNTAATYACMELGASIDVGQGGGTTPPPTQPPAPPVVTPPASTLYDKLTQALRDFCIPKDSEVCGTYATAKYQSNAAGVNKCECQPNWRYSTVDRACQVCTHGTRNDKFATGCTQLACPTGTYITNPQGSCPSGTYMFARNSADAPCPDGTYKYTY